MNKTWDYTSGSYSTNIFNEVKEDLENIFKCKLINIEGSDIDYKNCIDAWLVDEYDNRAGIAFRARKQLYKDLTIRYKKSYDKTAKTEYDKLMDPTIKIKPYYHVQVNDAGDFYVIAIISTNDLIDYMTINDLDIKTHDDGGQFIIIPWHDLKIQGYSIKAYRIPKK